MLTSSTTKIGTIAFFAVLINITAFSQNAIRPFSQIFSENIKGGTAMFGNGILHITSSTGVPQPVKMNETSDASNGVGGVGYSQYGNDNSNMQYIDIDTVSTTANSSSADLILPSGTNTIRFARLYWGGKINTTVVTSSPDTLRKIKISKGSNGNYNSLNALAANVDQFAINTTETAYQSFIDITNFINTNGSGTYTIADLPVTTGISSNGGRYGGWCIVVAYENPTQPYNSVRLYDGFAQVYNNGTTSYLTINLTGLNVPGTPLLSDEAVMGTMAWEGDANLGASTTNPEGDFIKINNITVSNYANPSTNFWNGSISKAGSFVSTKNPNYSNQMGIDIDEVNVGTGYNIAPNANSVTVQFGTEADMYFPSIFTFCIRVKDPTITLSKTVVDANNNGYVESNEILTYTLSGSNQGSGSSYNTIVVDSLPNNVTYVAGSLEVVNAAGVASGMKTDAQDADQAFFATNGNRNYVKFYIGNGANGTSGGELPSGADGNYELRFKVKSAIIPGTIVNTAHIYGNSVVGDLFTDDGTAVIGEAGGPTAVKLTSFTASLLNNSSASLRWTTQNEFNNDYFDIERSDDGIHFTSRGKVNGNGTTSIVHSYSFNDVINTSSPIVYYRLKVFDTDGQYSFSKVIALRIKGTTSMGNFEVFPNPFLNHIKVSLFSNADLNAYIRIISFDGKELMKRNVELQKGDNIIVLKDLGLLPPGSYLLEVRAGESTYIRKIVK